MKLQDVVGNFLKVAGLNLTSVPVELFLIVSVCEHIVKY